MLIGDARSSSAESRLRNEPVQARSAARLSTLLDSAAAVVDEVGPERLTTAMVADRAGASIGTVYRYFPDRVAVIEGLANRALSRFLIKLEQEFDDRGDLTLGQLVDIIVATLVDFSRNEPGYRVLRFGDTVEARVTGGVETTESALARQLGELLRRHEPDLAFDDLAFQLQVALAMCEVLVHRAFVSDPDGDPRFIEEARTVAAGYLAGHSSRSV
ncbi:TetR/AcrR family transcriptional regulator [Amnibacterium flavum]|uniref:TetR/AcrR family transcriptional regulator n=1 Tax=Amnibacterium flavum TaxID=2173173 RepID=UPI001403F828|nr:TetR/AcrR family transcriptional regulator [Amnibacterium flavum]